MKELLTVGKWVKGEFVLADGSRLKNGMEVESIDGGQVEVMGVMMRWAEKEGVGYKALVPCGGEQCVYGSPDTSWMDTTLTAWGWYKGMLSGRNVDKLNKRARQQLEARVKELVGLGLRVQGKSLWVRDGRCVPIDAVGGLLNEMEWQAVWYWRPMAILPLWVDTDWVEGIPYVWDRGLSPLGGTPTVLHGGWGLSPVVRAYRRKVSGVWQDMRKGGGLDYMPACVTLVVPEGIWPYWVAAFKWGVAMIPEVISQRGFMSNTRLDRKTPYFNGGVSGKCHGTAAGLVMAVNPRVSVEEYRMGNYSHKMARVLNLYSVRLKDKTGSGAVMSPAGGAQLPAVAWLCQREWISQEAERTGRMVYPVTADMGLAMRTLVEGLEVAFGPCRTEVERMAALGAMVGRLPVVCMRYDPQGVYGQMLRGGVRVERLSRRYEGHTCVVNTLYPIEAGYGYWTWGTSADWSIGGKWRLEGSDILYGQSYEQWMREACLVADVLAEESCRVRALEEPLEGGSDSEYRGLSDWEGSLVWLRDRIVPDSLCALDGDELAYIWNYLKDKGVDMKGEYGWGHKEMSAKDIEFGRGLDIMPVPSYIADRIEYDWRELGDGQESSQLSRRVNWPGVYGYGVSRSGLSGVVVSEKVDGRRISWLGDGEALAVMNGDVRYPVLEGGMHVMGRTLVRVAGGWWQWLGNRLGKSVELKEDEMSKKRAEGRGLLLENWVRGEVDVWTEDERFIRLAERVKREYEAGRLVNTADWVKRCLK